jgi:uncharacterized protein
MSLDESLKHEILKRLLPLQPEKIILFGSYAYGEPHRDSDLDLLVVTHDDFLPQNYKEKSDIALQVSHVLTELEKKIPIDLIVHTKKMYERFVELNSMFCRKIHRDGVILYERIDPGMVTRRSR